uniref:WD repeat domain-containing protein 83 n=1 Tax=Molossus molossus TaxID=27622 RepID=A0A7J8IDF2_MOLMO|nr:WD repeat domain 83 [Molossus molossus]
MDLLAQLRLQLGSTLSCSSVDGRVRRYDLRMGQLFSDYVGSECDQAVGQAGEARAAKGSPAHPPVYSFPPPRPHHLHLLQPGRAVHPGVQPGLQVETSRQGHGGTTRGVSPWSCGAPPPTTYVPGKAQAPLIPLTPRYTGHKNQEYKLDCCLSERDTHIVSCSEDGKVFFWDLVEGVLALTLQVGPGVVQSLAYHPTEPCLLTAMGGSIHCWREEAYKAESDTG